MPDSDEPSESEPSDDQNGQQQQEEPDLPSPEQTPQPQAQPMMMYPPPQTLLPGLENLALSGGVYIQQEMDIIEMMTKVEMNSRYQISNEWGQRIYYAGENTKCMDRVCFGRNRPFKVFVCDNLGYPVIIAEKKQSCPLCWFGTRVASSNVTVTLATTGQLLGSVHQNCSPCNPSYRIRDGMGKSILKIKGPPCGSCSPCFMCDATFSVVNIKTGDLAGEITKHFQITELISDATGFGLDFDPLMPAELKALLLAAVISIDFSFFEGYSGGNEEMKGCLKIRKKEKKKGIFPCNCTGCCCFYTWTIVLIVVGGFGGWMIFVLSRIFKMAQNMDKPLDEREEIGFIGKP